MVSVFLLAEARLGKRKKGPKVAAPAATLRKSRREVVPAAVVVIGVSCSFSIFSSNVLRKHTPGRTSQPGVEVVLLPSRFSGYWQNCPVCCKQVKFAARTGSWKLPLELRTASRNASEAMAPLRGSGMAGQTSQTAPPSLPSNASWPSAPHPLASSSSLSSCAVRMMGVPSVLKPFLAPMVLNTLSQVGLLVLGAGRSVNQK